MDSSCFPCVSIIIPNLNGLQLLRKSIPSILETDYPNFEIIVVDNGSDDGSVEFLSREFNTVEVIKLESNMGVAFAYNVGVN